ncbi:sensor histidine kinase [Halomonas elongata]|uniref:sensor histidine kinase n=1 Tax=Halomonas elongata TaxID=2746 RepID=UPI00334C39DE
MKERSNFKADAAIITRLGRELVAKQETALIELIKNCYDADATNVEVYFDLESSVKYLEIHDNGVGMSYEELINGFLRLASDLKVKQPFSGIFNRKKAGRKGIGRFATQRLGDKLILETKKQRDALGYKLVVDWDEFVPGKDLHEIEVDVVEVSKEEIGTRIRIEGLRDSWSEAQIRRAWRGVLSLQQPFPIAPVQSRPKSDPGFLVKFLKSGSLYTDDSVAADIQTEILDHLHAIIELKVEDDGEVLWRISENKFGEVFDWQRFPVKGRQESEVWYSDKLKNVWMKSYYVVLDSKYLSKLVFSRVRDELSKHGGIKLYRNGFRVVPYGEPNDDWLGLDEAYAKRSELAPAANRNFFGAIEVNDPEGLYFEEHTSREGLIETEAFSELKEIASSVLITAASRIGQERGVKTRAGGMVEKSNSGGASKVKQALSSVREAIKSQPELGKVLKDSEENDESVELLELVESAEREFDDVQQQLVDEAAMLRFLATLGMTTAEFSHETGMTFDAFRFDFEKVFDAAFSSKGEDANFLKRASRAKAMLSRLDTLTSYLNSLAGARASRDIRPISVSKSIEDFMKGIKLQAEANEVEVLSEVPEFDPLYVKPMHEAELASLVLNFYTNSVKALKRSNADRRLLISARREEENVIINFSDSGDGVPERSREKIFEPFFTTSMAPYGGASDVEHARGTGLGLWIVHQIVTNAGGEVYLIDPPEGYSTCFEVVFQGEDSDG